MDAQVSSRIAMLRFAMIAGVVVLHTPTYVPIAETGHDLFSFVKAFFQHAFFRGSVPVLTFISGYLLFSSDLDLHPTKLFAKKARALLLPFLVFNLSVMCVAYVAHLEGISLGFDFLHSTKQEWLDALVGFSNSPINYPLNFLRDMIVLMIITPLLGALLRGQSFIGLAGVVLFFVGNYDGAFILRNDMPVVFYVGGMAAFHKWDMKALDKHAMPLFCVFVLLCAYFVVVRVQNVNTLRYLAPALLWPAASLLQSTFAGKLCIRLSKYSFFIFVAHAPVLAVLWMLYRQVPSIPYVVFWITAPILVVAILIGVYNAAMLICPSLFRFVLGMEGKRVKADVAIKPA